MSIDHEDTQFEVVVNDQDQYSIWPTYHPIPEGWQSVGVKGNRQTCLQYISETWVDMRPRSLREALEQ
ncbi:MbtH domain protein [Nitrosococcus halophilus Nc 4]|uniref:MbtH domain protein n=2 Tax=Nitrosococcus TaxID=1227 RepID=D5C314_NITHN|nr:MULTISPECIES: MbtH family NRPS accessory protein [Nitrosococcus]ADE14906.1 MbtH domain protein [Nitrosococcus halophilus Nc 4]QBQ55215.1 MbtH family NRPS accessory protein [Nitrosococcus wardiae]